MLERAKTSTDATIVSQELLAYITSCNIIEWRGSTHDFVLNWEEQNRRYVSIVVSSQAIPSVTKNHLLQNAVQSIPVLKNIEDTVTILEKGIGFTSTATPLSSNQRYSKYKQLLIEACQTYDAKARSSRSRHRATKALLHQLHNPYDTIFDVNTDVDMLMAYRSMRTPSVYSDSGNRSNMQHHSSYVPYDYDSYDQQLHNHHLTLPSPLDLQNSGSPMESLTSTAINSHEGTWYPQDDPNTPPNLQSKLHHSQWQQLTAQEQVLWDQFSPASKKVITNPPPWPPPGAKKPPPTPGCLIFLSHLLL